MPMSLKHNHNHRIFFKHHKAIRLTLNDDEPKSGDEKIFVSIF
jgi:hypothetical protein